LSSTKTTTIGENAKTKKIPKTKKKKKKTDVD